MLSMSTAAATADADRIVLVREEQERPLVAAARPIIRRYRLARLRLDDPPGTGAFAHLKRSYD